MFICIFNQLSWLLCVTSRYFIHALSRCEHENKEKRRLCRIFCVVHHIQVISPSDFYIYVISTLDTWFQLSRNPGLTLHDSHNMEFHVQWMTCLCKTMDSALGQWASVILVSSCFPWLPVSSDQSCEGEGGVWIEVARRARRFAGGPLPERAGEEPATTVSTRLTLVSHWGMHWGFNRMF